jgi:inorganic pyrophosphatase
MPRTTRAPSLLRLDAHDDEKNVIAVIETPKGTRTKLSFDGEREAFIVKKVLPEGMSFPFDFGFIPSTLGEDGDPLDVLVLMDEPAAPGVVVPCRVLGVIQAVQRKAHDTRSRGPTRNDRLIAVTTETHRYARCRSLRDVGAGVLQEIERFFVFYNAQKGVHFTPTGRAGAAEARRRIGQGRRAHADARVNGR